MSEVKFAFSGSQIPTHRSNTAIKNGVQNKILFKVVAGIGDQIVLNQPYVSHLKPLKVLGYQ